MRSLTIKLILAFLAVGLAGTALAAVFARLATSREFDRLVLDRTEADFVQAVTDYYERKGSWSGAAGSLSQSRGLAPWQGDHDRQDRRGPPGLIAQAEALPAFMLVDQDRTVIIAAGEYQVGDHAPEGSFRQETPIESGGQVVGLVLATGRPVALDAEEEAYLARSNRALLLAGAIALLAALILGAMLAGTLTRPLRELTAATRAVARGALGRQVPIRSRDELGELAASFNRMSSDLAGANDLRRRMTADIAHELRTPLTVIAGTIEGLRDGTLAATPERYQAMDLEAQQLKRLIDDLRTLSLAEAGELPLVRQTVAPAELLARAAAAFGHRAAQARITLRMTADEGLPDLNVDPDRLAQVLENLVSNAIRHSAAGGEIVLSARAEGAGVLLAVQDTGEGIAAEDLPHVFDRFYRGRAAPSAGSQSGLGLAIARSIVEAHGGTIAAASAGPGQGAAFTVRLPGGPPPS